MDDLSTDSDGRDVLRQRLIDKRKELSFLLQMIEFSPEMVAVIFHQAFVYKLPAVIAQLLSLEADELPEWDTLADAVQLAPWAQPLADTVLQEPGGSRFMTIAAALEFMYGKADGKLQGAKDDSDDEDSDEHDKAQDNDDEPRDPLDGNDDEERAHEEAGADWLADQGFDRKD